MIIFRTKNWVHSPSIELVPPDNPKNTLFNNFDLMKKFWNFLFLIARFPFLSMILMTLFVFYCLTSNTKRRQTMKSLEPTKVFFAEPFFGFFVGHDWLFSFRHIYENQIKFSLIHKKKSCSKNYLVSFSSVFWENFFL